MRPSMRCGSPIVAARMRSSLGVGASASDHAPSESDIVGPNLQKAVVTGDDDPVGAAPVHRPEVQVRCGSAQLTVTPAPVAGELDAISEDQVPGGVAVTGHDSQDAAAALGRSGTPHGKPEPLV